MTLFNYYLKQSLSYMMSFLIGALLYLLMIIAIYPTVQKMDGLNEMMKQMPKELNAIFNMQAGLQDINQFIAMEYYGMIFIILMLCFAIMLSNHLFGKSIENKSFANMMNLPYTRVTIMTQIQTAAIIAHLLLGIFMSMGCMVFIQWFIKNPDYKISTLIHLNVLGVIVFFIIHLFTITCILICKEVKHGILISSAVALLMYGLSIGSKLSEDVEWMKYLTVFSFYDSSKISTGDAKLFVCYGISSLIIVILFLLNTILFKNKNLQL